MYINISLAFSHISLKYHFSDSPVSKPRSKISRVVRTERPAPTHICWVSSLEPAFCTSRCTPALGRSFVKSCGDFILAGGGVPNKVLYGGDAYAFATLSTPEVGAGAQRRAPIWCVALRRQMFHPSRRAAASLADPGPTPPCCPSNLAKTKLQIRLGASTHPRLSCRLQRTGSPPHPCGTALPPGAAATGALDPVARPHMRRNMVNTTGGGTRLGASHCASHRCGSRSARWVSAAIPPIL